LKLFSAPSIERPARFPLAASLTALAVACVLILTLSACVSEPAPAAAVPVEPQASSPVEPQPASETTGTATPPESQSVREVPSIISSMRVPEPAPHVVVATLAEPGLPPPPALSPIIPTEITVLSSMPAPAVDKTAAAVPVALPEPSAPAPATILAAPAKAAAPAVKPTVKPTVKPAVASTTTAKTETLKTADPVPAPVVVPPAPVIVLPATPPSQARSVDAARTQPVAETRIETVRGERFELRFPGTGWIYLGDEEGKEGLRYETRRFETTQAVFAMNPETVGEYLLRFQRQNPVDQATETSLVRVVVNERASLATPAPAAAATASPVADPLAAQVIASTAAGTTSAPATPAATTTATATPATGAASATPDPLPAGMTASAALVDPASLIKLAKTELEAKRTQAAIEALDRYLELYPYGNDELFYLYGLAYEQDTPFRDIKKSWQYYKRVKDEYPRSIRWSAAADRIAYLEKHYFGLR